MSALELDQLVVENLANMDDAAKRVVALGDRLWKRLGETAVEWAEQNNWKHAVTEEEIEIAPPHWVPREEEEEWSAYFFVGFRAGDTEEGVGDEDYFCLTRYCGVGRGGTGFRFKQRYVKAAAWKQTLRASGSQLQGVGFQLDDDLTPYIPFRVEPRLLVQDLIGDEISESLRGFKDALEILKREHGKIDKLISKARGV